MQPAGDVMSRPDRGLRLVDAGCGGLDMDCCVVACDVGRDRLAHLVEGEYVGTVGQMFHGCRQQSGETAQTRIRG